MAKYAYEYGKRWHVETPRDSIGRMVDALHVGTTDEEIAAKIDAAIGRSKDAAKFTPAIKRECHDYAKRRHAKNWLLYAYVMGGRG